MNPEPLSFDFGWLALKLMGKSLYSNAWSAISELVANGFDARAKSVYVLVDAIDKKHSVVEIFDDGDGMTFDEMKVYTRVGFNKRTYFSEKHGGATAPSSIMGRKGIGKLAALYLSSKYYVWTKPLKGDASCWKMDFPEHETKDPPALMFVEDEPKVVVGDLWRACEHGTLLRLEDVNLVGVGEQMFSVLGAKLANYFALDSMSDRDILLCIRTKKSEKFGFASVCKQVAFKNMAYIAYSPFSSYSEQTNVLSYKGISQKIPYARVEGTYKHSIDVYQWDSSQDPGVYEGLDENGQTVRVPYKLTGWIGIHCTINSKDGLVNDKDFAHNHYYNPNQLRLYVRNKLAVENFLNVLNSTQTYANYIEGEIHFDLLDEDILPDIATANRQSVDEHDPRVAYLCKLLHPIIRGLISKRAELAAKVKAESQTLINARQNAAKSVFADQVSKDIDAYENLSSDEKSELKALLVNKIRGEVAVKDQHVIFFSHSSADKHFGDFFHELLIERGVRKEEMFYTSRDDDPAKYADVHPLADQIRRCIVQENTLLFFLTGYKYGKSQFCLFEGGAGWVTRGVGEYPILSVKYEHIPKFLTNGKNEMVLWSNANKGCIRLDRNTYQDVVVLLNKLIAHINQGRKIRNEQLVPLFDIAVIPKKPELMKLKKVEQDYMDATILEYWNAYVEPELPNYIKDMKMNER